MGMLEILNVQGGDVKLSYNTKDGSEAIRAKRYIGEMMRAGFVLLVEVKRNDELAFERALGFDATKGEYIIADFEGPANGGILNGSVTANAPVNQEADIAPPEVDAISEKPKRGRRKRVPMEDANATAVGRSAGG